MGEKKIIILGAGASIGSKRYPIKSSWTQVSDRMPSADNFFYDLFKTNKSEYKSAGFLNYLGLTFDGLNELITKAWNINKNGFSPEEWKGVNIEEVMTFFEVGAKMYPKNSNYQKIFKKSNDYLLHFIDPILPIRFDEQHCEYLINVFLKLNKNDTIISYNWDTIAEYTLSRINAIQLKNYAILLRSNKVIPSDFQNKGLLLKLHGSFNWTNCENKNCIYNKRIRPPFKKNNYKLLGMRELFTCDCGSKRISPIIVPPITDKMIHKNSFLKNQWLIARDKLLDVTNLVFIGYSFPPSDCYSEWIFRQLNFIEVKKNVKITIVNPDYKKRNSLVRKRYNSIFRGYEIEHFMTLKDYAK
jgi:hypothetical protein